MVEAEAGVPLGSGVDMPAFADELSHDRLRARLLSQMRPKQGVGARMRAGRRASNHRARHLPMRYETGLPSSVIRFRT